MRDVPVWRLGHGVVWTALGKRLQVRSERTGVPTGKKGRDAMRTLPPLHHGVVHAEELLGARRAVHLPDEVWQLVHPSEFGP